MNRTALHFVSTLAFGAAVTGVVAPVQAQFGGLLNGISRSPDKTGNGCPKGKSRSGGSQVLGSILGSVAGSAASRVGGVFTWVPISGLTDQLTAAIACKLDPEEQKQAAQATLDATRGTGVAADVEVGSSASWTSGTRQEVSGTSTVVARNEQAGLQCLVLSDVVIVRGEETRADKRMCRKPPAARYALVA
jgi:hypothetical protein